MITMKAVMNQLTGPDIVDALVKVMAEKFEDFAEAQNRYHATMRALQDELGEDSTPSVKDEMAAIQRQTASTLFFSALLGIKANLDNFINPMARNFLDVGTEIYLRENTSHRLPEYESAQEVRDRFYAKLSVDQQKMYEDVITYVSHLETAGPKLAHYWGYLLGNDILYRVIPGYHSDTALTAQYSMMVELFFGKRFGLD